MHSSNDAYRCHLRTHLPTLCQQPETRQRLRFRMDSLLALLLLDLEPARPMLQPLYSDRKGGRPPRDPVAMLRCLLLLLLTGGAAINAWAERLKGEPELSVLSGFSPQTPPSVGTLYDFLNRLLDGPYQKRCAHAPRASERLRSHTFVRLLSQEKESRKATTQAQLALTHHRQVGLLVEQALAVRDQGLPQDFEQRLNEILMRCAVVPSAVGGFLGDLKRLVVVSDGTAILSHADGAGHAHCSCRAESLPDCTCPRYYSDPDATWGWDSHRERYVFGSRVHVATTRGDQQDLPLSVSVAGAHPRCRDGGRVAQPPSQAPGRDRPRRPDLCRHLRRGI